jgi:MFS family permease
MRIDDVALTQRLALARSARRGWRVVGGALAIMSVTFGVTYGFAPFFASLQQEFAAPRGAVSLAFSIAVPLYFALGAISGPLADRFGPRRVSLVGMIIGGIGLVYAARAQALWQVYLGYGAGIGICVGFSYVPAIGAVQLWFVRRRGFASGLAVSGIGLGTLCGPLAASQLIDWLGWRGAWTVLGLFTLLAGSIATWFLDGAPERRGMLPDGGIAAPATSSAALPAEGATLREALASRPFWLLYFALISISMGAFIPFVHLVPFAEDHGIGHGTAVEIFSLVGIGSTAGRFFMGGIADRLGRRRSLAALFLGMALMMLWWLASSASWQLALFALVYGTCFGGFVALYPALTVDYFGTRNASGIIGLLYTAAATGTLIGPTLAGDAFDFFASYSVPIAAGAGFAGLAVVLTLMLPEAARLVANAPAGRPR